ncbi:Protein of unknown function DUF262 [Galbibacter orientalis DSM 19592]|uniref:GmrSD restriction endonucleases N-terminal domain-containing protein n=1 Tax=Galbibacter orientalis DSM 19592 TaxID=926559 RepID=I3C8H1_9FLAO|nr:DUF262 domain-containing protein [Galbibacter orientalis]EIJ39914.1 Protein of unknown function DUF262 [Galbibacter orientalis DSM 19592]
MEISKKLTIRPETVETIFDYYQNEKLLVNRRYQRKLVWTIKEKKAFIDSLSLNLPVPLILVAEVKYKKSKCFEIIDGMQRLDAITTFIEGEFTLNGKYFDLETIASTKLLKDSKKLRQKQPVLDRELCKNIASYPIPLSVTSIENDSIIDDIFKRINSNGRHLSNQELRQAGLDNSFGYLVRKISESIRGDVSVSDKLLLNNMKSISINNKSLKYGIDMGGIFWRKHNLVSNKNIRQSRDEEMVAHLLGAILLNPRPSATAGNIDNFYSQDKSRHKIVDDKIKKMGNDYIINTFQAVYSEFRKTFESTGSNFEKTLFKKRTKYVNRSFQVVFLTFYDMLVKEQKIINDHKKLAKAFEGVGDKFITSNAEELNLSGPREDAINAIKGICNPYFINRSETDPVLNNGVMKLEGLLGASKTENTSYDFKIGTHRLTKGNEFDEQSLTKMIRTLTAIANAGRNSIGYIVIGVADGLKDKNRFEDFYKINSKQYKDFYVTGLDAEVKNYPSDEKYREKIENIISRIDITPSNYKDQILRNIDYFKYYGKSVMILKIEALDEPARFENKYYERHSTNTIEVKRDKEKEIWKRFI